MKKRKPPKLRKRMLHKYVIIGLNHSPSQVEVKHLLARIIGR